MAEARLRKTVAETVLVIILSACGKEINDGPTFKPHSYDIARLAVSDGPDYNFGLVTVGSSKHKTFTVTNRGKSDASKIAGVLYVSAFSFKGGAYPGDGGTCQSMLLPAKVCTVVVTFAPNYVGSFEEALHLNFFNGEAEDKVSYPTLKGAGAP